MRNKSVPSLPKQRPESRRVLYLAGWNVQAVHEGIADFAREAGWILDNTMCYSGEIPTGVKVDGVICRHSGEPRILDAVRALGVPSVTFENDSRLPLPRVYYDEEAIGAAAARHLMERGFTTLCFLHLRCSASQMQRKDGFQRAVEAAGLRYAELAPEKMPPTWHPPPGEEWDWLRQDLAKLEFPVGIMATNDQIARPLAEALLDMGYRIPAQIAVVGAENDPLLCEIGPLPISSVETQTRRMGYEVAHLLDRLMSGEPAPRETLLIQPSGVVARSSSNVRALANVHAAEALHFIWEHYWERITVADVSRGIPLTRRRLQTLFHEHVGRTMREEITRLRLAEACRLLKTTNLMIKDIAVRSGFVGGMQLHRTLHAETGVCPRTFRLKGKVPRLTPWPAACPARPEPTVPAEKVR